MFDRKGYDKEYQKNTYIQTALRIRKDDKDACFVFDAIKEYAKDNNISVQKAILQAIDKFLSDKGYI